MDLSLLIRTGVVFFAAIILYLFWQSILAFFVFIIFNVVSLLFVGLSNIFKTIIHGSMDKNERLEIYDLSYIHIYWTVVNQVMPEMDKCFDKPVLEDVIELSDGGNYDTYLGYLKEFILPVASRQTQKYADYITQNFGTNYKTLWQLMKLHFDYVPSRMLATKVVMPNDFWKIAMGNCEDYTLFMSSILVNWGISHYICYDVYLEKCVMYIRTEGNTIIDANSSKFGELEVKTEMKFVQHYQEFIEVVKGESNKM